MSFYAHSENREGIKHDLVIHLKCVAELAGSFANKFGAREFGYWAGLWHDFGKFHPDFQAYIEHPTPARGPDHSSAGAIHSLTEFDGLAYLVAGHHGGLPSRTELKNRLSEKAVNTKVNEAIELARQALGHLKPTAPLIEKLPAFLGRAARGSAAPQLRRDTELFLRMVFSALVDADFLDTEAHFDLAKSAMRTGAPGIESLWSQFEANHQRLDGADEGLVNRHRREIYQACLAAATNTQGIFTLTVPTGGGKTLSGMGFALRHALEHGLDRVIVAVPYTSITEQTARVYRAIFGKDWVLEHHSAMGVVPETTDPVSRKEVWTRLASENWDAPIVVTTTVQLFESLFAHRTQACRKLHNIAKSVVILDEVQTLPTHLLTPILDVLQQLTDHYSVSVVLCTATQPALTSEPYLRGLRSVREIIPDVARYYAALSHRVRYEVAQANQLSSWQEITRVMRGHEQCLAVVNTKKDAFSLLDELNDPGALHLSTQMCGAHRLETLAEVRRRLRVGEPCRLVSTQVVEAGVDIDFPVVLRAMGPLDRIVQAAGRCNREGKLEEGRVVIFSPPGGRTPPGIYKTGTDTAASLLAQGYDLHDPETYRVYFRQLFQAADLDANRIQNLRESFDYPAIAQQFRMIADDSTPVVVRPPGWADEVGRLLALVRRESEMPRWLLRRLQPFLVNIRSRQVPIYQHNALLQDVVPGLWEWLGGYDPVRGITDDAREPDELVV